MKASTTRPGQEWKPPRSTERQDERNAMVATIQERWGVHDPAVLAAMAICPRHEFVEAVNNAHAYYDDVLPIKYGQLISQPQIVAKMTRDLRLTPDSKVLEIGTGSAYQAAILSYFTPHVYSIEIIKPMAEEAAARLTRLGYDPIRTRCGDGFNGWPEEAPFDAIIVTCAAGRIPPPLVAQLKPGGRLVIPVGRPFEDQTMYIVSKDAEGKTLQETVDFKVRFVPMEKTDISVDGK
jgi:protein-L-isoaspartate(D-aspartate) O-methyltransferase